MEIESTGPDWSSIPLLPMLGVLSFLDCRSLCNASQACLAWNCVEREGGIWTTLCSRVEASNVLPEVSAPNSKQLFCAWWARFRDIPDHVYYKTLDLFFRIKAIMSRDDGPNIELLPGASLQNVEEMEGVFKTSKGFAADEIFRFPDDLRCWYMLVRGQDLVRSTAGLFGGYSFYSHRVNMYFLPLHHVPRSNQDKLLPICADIEGKKAYYLVMSDLVANGGSLPLKRGNIIVNSLGRYLYFPLAETFTALLQDIIVNSETGNYRISKNCINLFPTQNLPSATTNGVTIEPSVLFIPENSIPGELQRHFWSYSINMRMDESVSPVNNCQLYSRHWEIMSSEGVDIVNGEGVIGLYPRMYPTANFHYQSACPISGNRGSMKGTFQMTREDRTKFDAVVPEFLFRVPEPLKE